MARRLAFFAIAAIILLAAVLLGRTLALGSPARVAVADEARAVDVEAAARRLAEGLRFETVSYARDDATSAVPTQAFLALHEHLARSYPLVHAQLERETLSELSLVYRWPGRSPARKPVLLMAHQDVVPVDAGEWEHPPFGGQIVDGELWGRGAIDDKSALYAILEAVELLLREGFQPEPDVYLFFGHDEELGGPEGAARAGELLRSRGVELDWVIDEGGFVADDLLPGATGPVALVGIAEKGSVTFRLSVDGPGGHSSIPPRHGNIGILSQAIVRLEASPMPGGIDGASEQLLLEIAPVVPFGVRVALANLWLFSPLVEAAMAEVPALDAMLRTTTAVTVVDGGVKSNVLPSHAEAQVNFRIKPGDSAESIEAHIRRVIDDERVAVARSGATHREASPVSPTDGPAFALLARTIRQSFPDATVVPYTVLGGTDARNFYALTANVYRFNPFRFTQDATSRLHGTNERLEVAQLGPAIDFYARLIEASGSGGD